MHEVGYLSGYEEKEYWLNQIDALAIMKLCRLYNVEIEEDEYSFCSRPDDGDVLRFFRKTMAKILDPYAYIHPYDDSTPAESILDITFHFRDDLTEEEKKIAEEMKKGIHHAFDDMSYEYWDEWDGDRLSICAHFYVGYGVAGIKFLEEFSKLKKYLKEVPSDVYHSDRITSGEAAASDH